MSSALTIAAVTAIIKNLLENSLIQQAVTTGMGDITITTLPPDRIAIGAEERPQINLYLYRLTPNTGWRHTAPGHTQEAQPEQALTLNLHYLLSAYSERDFQAEILLGVATQSLYDASHISGEHIRTAFNALASHKSSGHTTLAALVRSSVPSQLAQINITPEFLSLEDFSKLWSGFQARARLSMTYKVTVMLHPAGSGAEAQPLQTTR
ncbi:MAG TPA: DUF4255 domain-containing protein [Ktedonobacteraceae bacterium]|nr:DUF4255 domain-containing protein [Ktedonobacteraceae bacterium]